MDRKPPRFNFIGKRTCDNNDSLTTPVIDPNAPLPSTGLHFPSFDHHDENPFGQYLQELSQSVSSDVYENVKLEKSNLPSPSTSIPTPAIKYNHRHQQSQQSQLQPQIPSHPQVQSAHQPQNSPSTNNHPIPNGTNDQTLNNNNSNSNNNNNLPLPPPSIVSNKSPSSDSKSSYQLSTSPSSHDYSNYLSPKHHGGIDYGSNNSGHLNPMPVTVITTGFSSLTAQTASTFTPHLSRITEINNQRLQLSPALVPSSSSTKTSDLSNHIIDHTITTNSSPLSMKGVDSSSSRSSLVIPVRRQAPFSPVSTLSTSSQASTVGKESAQYIAPSGSDEEQTSRATPGRKKKVDPNRRSKLTKREKLNKIIDEEKRLLASNSTLKQKIKVMERESNMLHTILTNILIDAAKHKRSDNLRSRQGRSEETS